MGVRLIRENSDTPNVTNKDDARMVRYAYGGQNGYVQKYGRELDYIPSGNIFTIGSGIAVLQGWEVVIDSNGWQIELSTADATKRYYSIYLEVNLALGGTAEIKSTYDNAEYPTVNEGDDLTENLNGIARLELYRFTATRGVVADVEKRVSAISYNNDILAKIADGTFLVGNAKKINDIELKVDENGVLKIGDIIIPQRKPLWVGNKSTQAGTAEIVLSEPIRYGEKFSIYCSCNTFTYVYLGWADLSGTPIAVLFEENVVSSVLKNSCTINSVSFNWTADCFSGQDLVKLKIDGRNVLRISTGGNSFSTETAGVYAVEKVIDGTRKYNDNFIP